MVTREITPSLAAALRSLAETQMQIQVSRSAALDASAVGVIGVDAAIAATVVEASSPHHLWIAALALLGVSLIIAARALLMQGAEKIGPLVVDVLADRHDQEDQELERWLLDDLAADMLTNRRALARKTPHLTVALVLMLLAIVIELASGLH